MRANAEEESIRGGTSSHLQQRRGRAFAVREKDETIYSSVSDADVDSTEEAVCVATSASPVCAVTGKGIKRRCIINNIEFIAILDTGEDINLINEQVTVYLLPYHHLVRNV